MSNSTVDVQLVTNVFYVPIGAVLLLLGAIVRHTALRNMKEFIPIACLAFADPISGFATLFGGVYRLSLLALSQSQTLASRRFCTLTPHMFLWDVSGVLQGIMLLAVSLDRLLLVIMPVKYIALDRRHILTPLVLVLIGVFGQAIFFTGADFSLP